MSKNKNKNNGNGANVEENNKVVVFADDLKVVKATSKKHLKALAEEQNKKKRV